MDKAVLDASAILAVIGNEPGADLVFEHIPHAAVSTVNLAEVQSKLIERGFSPDEAWESALSFARELFVFDAQQASTAGGLVPFTRPFGLSLGDRACLALAITLKAPVYTTDRIWANLALDVDVRLLR